jgi:hypothetical protein
VVVKELVRALAQSLLDVRDAFVVVRFDGEYVIQAKIGGLQQRSGLYYLAILGHRRRRQPCQLAPLFIRRRTTPQRQHY